MGTQKVLTNSSQSGTFSNLFEITLAAKLEVLIEVDFSSLKILHVLVCVRFQL